MAVATGYHCGALRIRPKAAARRSHSLIMTAALIVAPFFIYPLFLMQALCFALFACAFNLLIGYVGLLSFGHALYFGWASYLCRACRQRCGVSRPSSRS
jgi:ABC-type branched-subunit amino acid transport system permease subunit